jgi:hypothetical protein
MEIYKKYLVVFITLFINAVFPFPTTNVILLMLSFVGVKELLKLKLYVPELSPVK